MTDELSGRRVVVPETRELRRAKPRCKEDACRGSFALSSQSESGSALGQSSVCNFRELLPNLSRSACNSLSRGPYNYYWHAGP